MRSVIGCLIASLIVLCGPMISSPAVGGEAPGAPLKLHIVQFPERRSVDLAFARHPRAPAAEVRARVRYRQGQARIQFSYRSMKPAILFGGDVTCYVVWAVTLDGATENLGELIVRYEDDDYRLSTGKKNFALLITAEPNYLVREPSGLVMFTNLPSADSRAPTTSLDLPCFGPVPERAVNDIAETAWDSGMPLDLLQARKALELARREGADEHASQLYAESGEVLEKAERLAEDSPHSRTVLDLARRSVALSNVAGNISRHQREAAELERQITERRLEMATLGQRARQAEVDARQSQTLARELRTEMTRLRDEKERITAATARLVREKRSLELAMESLRQDKTALELTRRGLQKDKAALGSRLETALAQVAETRKSARGLVVSLPDILFDLDRASLKQETRVTLAKLAGILLILPDQSVTIEGHTDSSGSARHNRQLSQSRARAVLDFLKSQNVSADRLKSVGYGEDQPVADNRTRKGRRRNRRVEIVFNEPGG